jgi:hypothetical protein
MTPLIKLLLLFLGVRFENARDSSAGVVWVLALAQNRHLVHAQRRAKEHLSPRESFAREPLGREEPLARLRVTHSLALFFSDLMLHRLTQKPWVNRRSWIFYGQPVLLIWTNGRNDRAYDQNNLHPVIHLVYRNRQANYGVDFY